MEAFFLGLALLLGVKHSFDADHLVAVGNLLTRAPSVRKAFGWSLWWSLGHMLTAGLLSVLLVLGRDTFWPEIASRLDVLVPIMLVVVGVLGLLHAARVLHAHRHAHGGRAHAHLHAHVAGRHEGHKLGLIGLVHGLASNDELLLLLTATLGAATVFEALVLVALFSLGVVLGMGAYAAALQAGVGEARRPTVAWWTNVTLSVLSILYAGYLLAGGEGINALTPGR